MAPRVRARGKAAHVRDGEKGGPPRAIATADLMLVAEVAYRRLCFEPTGMWTPEGAAQLAGEPAADGEGAAVALTLLRGVRKLLNGAQFHEKQHTV